MNQVKVLDYGYVELIEAWGTGDAGQPNLHGPQPWEPDYEVGLVEAARQSTAGSFRGWEKDEKLLRHLMTNRHDTPFEFAGMVLEVRAPLFVFREWHRHRTQSYNEMSARYTPLPDLCYLPDPDMLVARAAVLTVNAQARGIEGAPELTDTGARLWLSLLDRHYHAAEGLYQLGLDAGVPKELARCGIPVGHYSQMRVSANLRCWLMFLTLRLDPLAQWEIRQYAETVGLAIQQTFPHVWALFCELSARRARLESDNKQLRHHLGQALTLMNVDIESPVAWAWVDEARKFLEGVKS